MCVCDQDSTGTPGNDEEHVRGSTVYGIPYVRAAVYHARLNAALEQHPPPPPPPSHLGAYERTNSDLYCVYRLSFAESHGRA